MYFKQKRFTLLELLVVVIIIGFLAAILLPAVMKAKYRATLTTDMNNLKQQANAAILYTIDYKDFYPYRVDWEAGGNFNSIKKADDDQRILMRDYLEDLNGLLNCPITGHDLDFENATNTNIESDYYNFWGTGFGTQRMKMIGNSLECDGENYNILASDYFFENQASGQFFSSHKDKKSVGVAKDVNTASFLKFSWGGSDGESRGGLDLNFVYDDGHAELMGDVMYKDLRLSGLFKSINKPKKLVWLPESD